MNNDYIPVIDLFAGPGGLGEGFSAVEHSSGGRKLFRIALSVEKEKAAHRTLQLRAFFREFDSDYVPTEYFQLLRGEITQEDLFQKYPKQAENAMNVAWKAELGIVNPHEVDQRIQKVLKGATNWVLVGGPPCQAYSVVGRSRMAKVWTVEPEKKEKDPRHFLYREYLRILKTHLPPVFIMENVRGMLSAQVSEGRISDLILNDLHQLKYRLYSFSNQSGQEILKAHPDDFIIKCEKYGIPQTRHRVIILGIRKDITATPEAIELQQAIPIQDIIGDLPKIRSGLSKRKDSGSDWKSVINEFQHSGLFTNGSVGYSVRDEILSQLKLVSEVLTRGQEYISIQNINPLIYTKWFSDNRINGVCNHSSRGHIAEDLWRYYFASCYAKVNKYSPKLRDFPKTLLPKHLNVNEGVAGNKFSDRFRVQVADRPATTITSHISKDGHYFIHYDPLQCRSLTVREAARIQTFPDNYLFTGPRTSQYIQVGNAVPPLLAQQLASRIYKLFVDANQI